MALSDARSDVSADSRAGAAAAALPHRSAGRFRRQEVGSAAPRTSPASPLLRIIRFFTIERPLERLEMTLGVNRPELRELGPGPIGDFRPDPPQGPARRHCNALRPRR